jgi:hypothetical protein
MPAVEAATVASITDVDESNKDICFRKFCRPPYNRVARSFLASIAVWRQQSHGNGNHLET